jgi:hypothetical protein
VEERLNPAGPSIKRRIVLESTDLQANREKATIRAWPEQRASQNNTAQKKGRGLKTSGLDATASAMTGQKTNEVWSDRRSDYEIAAFAWTAARGSFVANLG